MTNNYKKYSKAVSDLCSLPNNDPKSLQAVIDWYVSEGRGLFMAVFKEETGLSVLSTQNDDILIGHAAAKTFNDLDKKMRSKPYYQAHARWFLQEIGHILQGVQTQLATKVDRHASHAVFNFVIKILMDSKILISDYGTYVLEVPHAYGIGKNFGTHNVHFCQSAKQIIYGHGSYGLSFMDNHADTSIGIIRQSIEIKLMRVFGIQAKIRVSDNAVMPIGLSSLIDAIKPKKGSITFPLKFESIVRLNGWANMYLHSGQKEYAWCPPRILFALWPFLLAQKSKSEIQMDATTFSSVRTSFVKAHEITNDGDPTGFEILLADTKNCDVSLT